MAAHPRWMTFACALLAGVATLQGASAVSSESTRPSAVEISEARRWTAEHFGAAAPTPLPPFSFTLGGRSSQKLLPHWKLAETTETLDAQRTRRTRTYTDPHTGLVVRCVIVEYQDYPVVEWTVHLKNTGTADTPIIADLQALDTTVPLKPDTSLMLHHAVGSPCQANDYQPLDTALAVGAEKRIGASGGRSTNSDFSYFNLEWEGRGLILAVGWPGQWLARFARGQDGSLSVRAGQELTHFRLHPGEEVRTPLIALQFWQGGGPLRAQNTWRRWFIAHNIRRPGGQLPPMLWAGTSEAGTNMMVHATEANQRTFIDAYLARGLKPDLWWMDAGWYPCEGDWTRTGTWEADPARLPHGLRPVTDYLHEKGIRGNLWFEPERVRAGTWLATQHPEWVLAGDGDGLLDLGNPEAWNWLVERVDRLITEYGIDIYRQDFNMDCLSHWRAHDTPERQGITEIRYVTGLLAYWDELLRRHPTVLYDNCASGGRRNDLESMRRGVPFTKSDYAADPVGVQGETYGISLWLPYFAATREQSDDPYLCRSRIALAVGVCLNLEVKDHLKRLPERLAEWRKIAPCYWGDFWPLTPYSLDSHVWVAWQFDLPESGAGVVQAFRRPECTEDSMRVRLRGLDPKAQYSAEDADAGAGPVMSGEELMADGLVVKAAQKPAAVVVYYRKVR